MARRSWGPFARPKRSSFRTTRGRTPAPRWMTGGPRRRAPSSGGRRPCRGGEREEASGRRTRTARWRWGRSSHLPKREDGSGAAEHDVFRDDALLDLLLRGHAVHDVQHDFLEDDLQTPGADVTDERLFGDLFHGVVREMQVHVLEVEKRLVLLDEGILRFLQDGDERRTVEVVQRGDDRNARDELRDHPELDHVLGVHLLEEVAGAFFFLGDDLRAEAHRLLGEAAADDVLEADVGAAADEQDVRRVDLDEFLVRVLAAALRGHVRDGAFENLEERLLDALARHVARDGGVLALARDLVDLVNVDDAALGLFLVLARGLVELQDDVLDVLADITRLGERGGVRDREGHRQHPRERLRQKSLARTRRADQEDVRLLELDIEFAVLLEIVDPLVVVVDRDGELSLGRLLPDDVLVEEFLDLARLRELRLGLGLVEHPVLGDDVEADVDAFIADVDRRPRDELLHVPLGLVAEATAQNVPRTRLLRHAGPDLPFRTPGDILPRVQCEEQTAEPGHSRPAPPDAIL